MRTATLVLRGLTYHRATHAAAAAALAVATAAIVAALLVGAATQKELRAKALARIGGATHVLVPVRPLPEAVVAAARAQAPQAPATVLLLRNGSAENANSNAVAPLVRVIGVDADLSMIASLPQPPQGRRVLVSQALAGDLGLKVDDEIVLEVGREQSPPYGSLFAQHKRGKLTAALRVEVAAVLPPGGAGDLAFVPDGDPGRAARSVLIDRAWLARSLGSGALVDQVALRAPDDAAAAAFATAAATAAGLDVLGISLIADGGAVRVQSASLILGDAIRETGRATGWKATASSVYLVDRISCGARSSSYLMAAGFDAPPRVQAIAGTATGMPEPGTVWLNAWLAEDLGAKPGDQVEIAWPEPAPDGSYPLRTISRRVAAVVADADDGANPGLVPSIPGITNAVGVADWDAPFPVDLKRVVPRDDEWWKLHHAAPRLIVPLDDLKQCWTNAGDGRWCTGLRLEPPSGTSAEAAVAQLRAGMLAHLPPADVGLAPIPVRALALAAAPATDPAQLLLALGAFVILAALALAALALRLQADLRSRELGLLGACGFTPGRVRRLLLAEWACVATVGALAGMGLGLVGARGLHLLLNGPWAAAGAATTAPPDFDLASGVIGAVSGWVLGMLSAWLALRRLQAETALTLIAGGRALSTRLPRGAGWGWWVAAIVGSAATVAGVALGVTGKLAAEAAAFIAGAGVLMAALALVRLLLPARAAAGALPTRFGLLRRALALQPLRALVPLALSALAAFLLVAVAAQRRGTPDGGDGGYRLRLDASLPLGVDPGTSGGRAKLGFTPDEERLFAGVAMDGLPVAPGDELSCRAESRPMAPRLVGLAAAGRGRCTLLPDHPDGWRVLEQTLPNGVLPAVGDSDSVQWILQAGVGDELTAIVSGKPQRVRIVALLPPGLFAGELVVSAERLRPLLADGAPSRWLAAMPAEREAAVAEVLRKRLGSRGVSVVPVSEQLAAVLAVRSAYLDAFLALGGVGLLLAALGLGIAHARNALERRREAALMTVLGFRPRSVLAMLATEQGLLIAVGVLIGAVAAVAATAPVWTAPGAVVAWGAVGAILGGMLVLGCAGAAVSAWALAPRSAAAALRRE